MTQSSYPKESSRIHLFKVQDQIFVFDVHSCVFFAIDSLARDVLEASCRLESREQVIDSLAALYGRQKAEEVVTELENLERKGVIFSKPLNSSNGDHPIMPPAVLCLYVAQSCNLRCAYCFAEGGDFGKCLPPKMSSEVAKATVDFLMKHSASYGELNLAFFGGEPLLNFPVIVETTAYADKVAKKGGVRFGYSITTNGTLLDAEKLAFLNQHDFSIIFSLDGPPEIHNRQRPFANGRGSHRTALKNLDRLVASRPDQHGISVRGTFTRQSPKLAEMVLYLGRCGYKEVSVEPAYTQWPGLRWQPEDLEPLKDQYSSLALQYLEELRNGHFFAFFHFKIMMDSTFRQDKNTAQCGAGVGYLTVASDGSLFPCHKLVGKEEYRLGDVFSGINRLDLQKKFSRAQVFQKSKCLSCWARFVCGGGCHAYNLELSGDILEPYAFECELMKHKIELGAYLYAQLTPQERQLFGYSRQNKSWCQPTP